MADIWAKLQLEWSAGYQGTSLAFVDDSTLVYASGNTLTFIGRDGTHIKSIPSQGNGVECIAVCSNAGLLAYSERSLSPRIFVLSWPKLKTIGTFKGGAQLGYTHLEFFRSGNYMLSISDMPDFRLTLWRTTEGKKMCDTEIGPGVWAISFNPLNWKQICALSANGVKLWNVEQTGINNLFTNIEVQLPFQTTPIGTVVEPKSSSIQSISQDSRKELDLSVVLYSDVYIDSSSRPQPVTPKSHCWTPNGSVYCGCEGGELFLVESESGSATVLISSGTKTDTRQLLLSKADEMFGGDQSVVRSGGVGGDATVMGVLEEEVPSQVDLAPTKQPAHLVLSGGDLDAMALNRKGLYVSGKNGMVYCLELTQNLTVLDHFNVGAGVTSLHWSSSYDKLALTTDQCVIYLMEPFNLCNLNLVVDYASEEFVGVDVLNVNSNFSVTCRRSGTVQVWSTNGATLVSTLNLQTQCCCIHSLPSCSGAVLGAESGHLYFLSLVQPRRPYLVSRQLLYRTPLSLVSLDQDGHFVAAASEQATAVHILDARPGSGFKVVGRLDVGRMVSHVSMAGVDRGTVSLLISSVDIENQKTLCTLCSIPTNLADKNPDDGDVYADPSLALNSGFVKKCSFLVPHVVEKLSVFVNNKAFGILSKSREIATIVLPCFDFEVATDLEETMKVNDMKVKSLGMYFDRRCILLTGTDGRMQLRSSAKLSDVGEVLVHDIHTGGCIDAALSPDSTCILSVGDSGLLLCSQINYQQAIVGSEAVRLAEVRMREQQPLYAAQNAALKTMPAIGNTVAASGPQEEKEEEDEEAVRGTADGSCEEMLDQIGQPQKQESLAPSRATSAHVSFRDDRSAASRESSTAETEKTWLEATLEQTCTSDEDQYSELKGELRRELEALRSKVLGMIKTNEDLPDIERLDRQEFILDTDEHSLLLKEEESAIEKAREELELSNLANLYVREVIKKKCWDDMDVKGRVLKAFQSPIEVSNYTLRHKLPEEVQQLERVKTVRDLEMAERKARAKFVSRTDSQPEEGLDEDEDLAAAMKEDEEGGRDPYAMVGSSAAGCGGESHYLYGQFEMHSVESMRHQIMLHLECVDSIKQVFNKEFGEVFKAKEAELQRIKERNVRIGKIIHDLQLKDAVCQPSLDCYEDPNMLMEVQDSEVTVEKYLSPEEKKQLEGATALEEERRLAEIADNWRKRALDVMMDGRLEANLEEDLFKDLVKPDFIGKPPEAMTEEEIKLAKEFEKKEQELLDEREKYMKALEAELRRLQEATAQGMESFDEKLKKLFYLKIRSEISINQEELKVLRLGAAVLRDDEIRLKEEQLHGRLEDKKSDKISQAKLVALARQEVEREQQDYDMSMAEDKDLDKAFKKEFADCEAYLDQLYKLYKKRPRGQRLKGADGGLQQDPSSTNPFSHRPVSTLGGKRGGGGVLIELDHPSNMPEGVDRPVWDRLVQARRKKHSSEQKVKHCALELASAQAFLDARVKEDDGIQQDIQDTFRELNILRDAASLNALNLEVQLLLKQGQVEVETGQFIPNYSDCILMNRKIVEDLNAEIKELGKAKIGIMGECKDFKKFIHLLEWEHKKIRMEAEDLITKTKDIHTLKVTKELQKRLVDDGRKERTFQQENEVLEKTLALNEKMSQKALKDRQRALIKLRQQIEAKKKENVLVDKELRELQVCVLERKEIEDLAGVPPNEANAEAKMQDIVLRRRMVETAKAQAQEISVLRAELDRLRMRTFPALVQADI